MEKAQDTREKPQEKDLLNRRTAAALVVFFVSGPLFFIIWAYFASNAPDPMGATWALPIAATVFCTIAALFVPERMVNYIGKLMRVFQFLG